MSYRNHYMCSGEATIGIIKTSDFATTHEVAFLWVCKTSYHLLILPPPTNLPNSLPLCHTLERNWIHNGETPTL